MADFQPEMKLVVLSLLLSVLCDTVYVVYRIKKRLLISEPELLFIYSDEYFQRRSYYNLFFKIGILLSCEV